MTDSSAANAGAMEVEEVVDLSAPKRTNAKTAKVGGESVGSGKASRPRSTRKKPSPTLPLDVLGAIAKPVTGVGESGLSALMAQRRQYEQQLPQVRQKRQRLLQRLDAVRGGLTEGDEAETGLCFVFRVSCFVFVLCVCA